MQLYIIDWSFQNAEDQLFARNEFCEYLKAGKIKEYFEGFELIFIAHTPQNGSGIIICKAQNTEIILKLLNMWRENYNILFNIRPALTNDQLLELSNSDNYWGKI